MRAWIIAAGIMVASGGAFAQTPAQDKLKAIQADPAALKHAIEAGQKASFFCVNCHGEAARGDATIPRLAGQQIPYVVTSVTRYRDGTGIRNNQLMSIATSSLKNEEIKAIANYLTQLP